MSKRNKVSPDVAEAIEWLKRVDQPGLAIGVRNLAEENRQLQQDISYEKQRRELAEKTLLREWDKSIWEKIFR